MTSNKTQYKELLFKRAQEGAAITTKQLAELFDCPEDIARRIPRRTLQDIKLKVFTVKSNSPNDPDLLDRNYYREWYAYYEREEKRESRGETSYIFLKKENEAEFFKRLENSFNLIKECSGNLVNDLKLEIDTYEDDESLIVDYDELDSALESENCYENAAIRNDRINHEIANFSTKTNIRNIFDFPTKT